MPPGGAGLLVSQLGHVLLLDDELLVLHDEDRATAAPGVRVEPQLTSLQIDKEGQGGAEKGAPGSEQKGVVRAGAMAVCQASPGCRARWSAPPKCRRRVEVV